MSPESRIIAQAMHEYSAGALHEGYGLLRQHLASAVGELGIAQAVQQTEAEQAKHEKQNVRLIQETVDLLPSPRFYSPEKGEAETAADRVLLITVRRGYNGAISSNAPLNAFSFENKPENYLALHGLLDRIVWIERRKKSISSSKMINWQQPAYVVGASKRLGLLGYEPREKKLFQSAGWGLRRHVEHYSQIMRDPDTEALKQQYNPKTDRFDITSKHASARSVKGNKALLVGPRLSDADMHEYGVVNHLMNLSALFNVQREWGRVLLHFTKDAPREEVDQLKQILEARYGTQPELPVDQTETSQTQEKNESYEDTGVDQLDRKARQDRFKAVAKTGLPKKYTTRWSID